MSAPQMIPGGIRSTCPYCGVGCGVIVRPDTRTGVEVAGDGDHPSNFGRLCSKGSALGETLALDGRLAHPMFRARSGAYERVSWDAALDRVAEGFSRALAESGPDAIAFYLSGQLLTEDYYVANKLMKGYLGSANVDTNSRLCMASSVAGHKRAFGEDVVPGNYADIDEADLIVLVGSNSAWCHPVIHQRIIANKTKRGARMVVIDPRRTPSADDADLFLPIAPGMDGVLFSWLLATIADLGKVDTAYVRDHTTGFESALSRARSIAPDIETVARLTGLPASDITAFCDLWLETERVVTAWSQGVNQSAVGTDKVNAIINCHLATARIGGAGQGPFSLTGQPNAMGGREVGGLANMLAAHMGFSAADVDRVGRFWNAPNMARREGLKAVAMLDAIARGRVRALWTMATNPAVSLPRADQARDALSGLDLFVASEVVLSNDTLNAGAHVLLPAAAWGEKDGTVTNSERRISRQRSFLPAAGEARPDWWIVCEIAKRLGFGDAFAFSNAAAIFREHAALSAFENDGARVFDIGEFRDLSDHDYARLSPTQWPRAGRPGERLFGDGHFPTPDDKARFVAIETPRLARIPDATKPLLLNTGRVRDHWHTMTRTGKSPRLAAHTREPFVAIGVADALAHDLHDGGFARVASARGEAILRVRVDAAQRDGEIFAPIHWSAETSSHGRVGALVEGDVDPVSGQPELKATAVSLEGVDFAREGFLLSRDAMEPPADDWWSRVAVPAGTGWILATNATAEARAEWFAARHSDCEIAEFEDFERGVYRVAAFRDDMLRSAMFIAPRNALPDWGPVTILLASERLDDEQRRLALAAREPGGAGPGPTVCACFSVGLATITEAISTGRAISVEAVGQALKAGTNCGSCVPEIRRLIGARQPALA